MLGSRDYPEWWLQTFHSWEPPLVVVCCGQNSVCKPYHKQSFGMHNSFKDYNDNVSSPGFGSRFQLFPPEASPAWGPLMWVKWNPVLGPCPSSACLRSHPRQWSQEGAWCEGMRFLCSAHLKTVWRYFCHCPVPLYAGTCKRSVLVLFPHFC